MTMVTVFPGVGDSFVDARGDGRSLRVSWHAAQDVFVLSIWHDETCAATFQLSRADAAGLLAGVAEGLAERPSPSWSAVSYSTPA